MCCAKGAVDNRQSRWAPGSLRFALCTSLFALRSSPFALCLLRFALFTFLFALCSPPLALCAFRLQLLLNPIQKHFNLLVDAALQRIAEPAFSHQSDAGMQVPRALAPQFNVVRNI